MRHYCLDYILDSCISLHVIKTYIFLCYMPQRFIIRSNCSDPGVCVLCVCNVFRCPLCQLFSVHALSISVRGQSPGQLGEGLGRTGGWGCIEGVLHSVVCVCVSVNQLLLVCILALVMALH